MSDPRRFHSGRHVGVLVPLFSIPSTASWGIGEIPDLPRFAAWLEQAGLDFVQLLPVNEMADGQNSPYSAMSAMAIDPIYIAVADLDEFRDAGGEAALPPAERQVLADARGASSVQYGAVRALKRRVLDEAFHRFADREWDQGTPRAGAFEAFRAREGWWLEDYVLFRALHEEHESRYWLEWGAGLRDREPGAIAAARLRLERRLRYFAWLQWVAAVQWDRARAACGRVGIFGDFPFMVSGDSADVWARQEEFRVDVSVGVPPDAFSDTGQDWGLPAYRWDVMAPGDYEWLRQRARRCAALYDGFRVDHLVGFYRTFVREQDGRTAFVPPGEPEQRAQGERLLQLFEASGARIVVEDLGTVPAFVRDSLAAHRAAGLKVLRWERDWHQEGHPFHDPAAYPPDSVAVTGTHDTETMAEWWDGAPDDERAAALAIPAVGRGFSPDMSYSDDLRDRFIEALYGSGSDLLLLAIQDIFGWRDRVNTPAVVDDQNWSWRLPWPVDSLRDRPEAEARAAWLRAAGRRHHRSSL